MESTRAVAVSWWPGAAQQGSTTMKEQPPSHRDRGGGILPFTIFNIRCVRQDMPVLRGREKVCSLSPKP